MKIYMTNTYDGRHILGVDFGGVYYTNIHSLSFRLDHMGLIHNRDFIKAMKKYTKKLSLSFESEEKMLEAKEYIESLLIMAQF